MSKNEQLTQFLSDERKQEEETEEELASLPSHIPQDEMQVEYLRAKIDRQKEEIEGLRQDRKQRKTFSYYIFGFMCAYMAAVVVIIFFNGFNLTHLSDRVLITLLTTSLVNVIGIFNFVAKYLFPPHKD